ncbi:hypothetical protein BHE97_12270 [Aeromicrobium sp. PE09-221]|uniref:hypothetical protein n=1 Tax=Aeromicrobium sp. PE09-221 TaxID=1898043 RepID=UPI000B3ED7A2|nr:hypothetical protein [Aeromicrobium sp. PE09-221]OUZ08898.1 hypothetical protein BHE97_12270 [Aeromicrobium sp. PE09-221]
MSVTRHRHIARRSRLGIILAASGASALVAATVLTIGPSAAQAGPGDQAADGAAPSTASVQVLTPRIDAGGTARIVIGVVNEGVRPEGRVQVKIGDRVLTRDLTVGTASASVRIDEPGTIEVRARHIDHGAAVRAAWSDAVTIAVR